VAVVEHGNVLHAARAIHISQPALTKSIQNLESELGVPLLDRLPRGVTPTIYGKILFDHAKLLQNAAAQAVAEIRAVKEGRGGHLRLGIANFAIDFLPRVIAKLVESTPGLTFDVLDGTYEDLTALVREGALDAVISGFPPLHRAEDLTHEKLIAGEFVIVCSADHPLARKRNVTLAATANESWALANRPVAIVELWELEFRFAHVTPPRPLVESGSMIFLKSMVAQSRFVTFLPRGVVAEDLASGRLAAVPIPLSRPAKTAEGIIYRAGAVHPPALRRLVEAIRQEQRGLEEQRGIDEQRGIEGRSGRGSGST
jgi:DNA-binding transcriptional LysR family regulator